MEGEEASDQKIRRVASVDCLRIRVWRLSLRRAIGAIISWVGSFFSRSATPCEELNIPLNGARICNGWMRDYISVCLLACKENFTIPPTHSYGKLYVCAASGSWIFPGPMTDCSGNLARRSGTEHSQNHMYTHPRLRPCRMIRICLAWYEFPRWWIRPRIWLITCFFFVWKLFSVLIKIPGRNFVKAMYLTCY